MVFEVTAAQIFAVHGWRERWIALLDRILRVSDNEQLQLLLDNMNSSHKPNILAFVNAHAMNSVAQSTTFYEALFCADHIVRDGTGMLILFKILSIPPGLNLNGTDLIPKIIKRFDGQTIALYGTREPHLSSARDTVIAQHAPNSPVFLADGFQDVAHYIAMAQEQKPSLVVLGMGMPKQEQVAAEMRAALDHPCLIVCGGAIIDFLGGKISRAPVWMRKMGAEWAYRLALEPGRLFNRYVIGNPVFLMRSIYLSKSRL